jgi:hypothetical protein
MDIIKVLWLGDDVLKFELKVNTLFDANMLT